MSLKSNIKLNIRLNFYHRIICVDFFDGTFANNKILRTNIMHLFHMMFQFKCNGNKFVA